MDFKISDENEDNLKQSTSGDKGRQNILLIVLLLLVAGFAYIYYFTGLIRPQEAQKPVVAPVPQVVKKALPPRVGETGQAAVPAAPDAKQAPVAPVKPEPAKAKVAQINQVTPATAPAAKEAPRPKEEPKKTEPAKPALKTPQPAVAEKKEQKPAAARIEEKKPATAEKKQPAVADKKTVPAVSADKKGNAVKKAAAKPDKKSLAEPGEGSAGRWTLVVGNYLLEDALATDMVRVRKAGLEAAVQPGARKKSSMNRLFLGEYGDRSAARAELDKLKRHTSDAFIIEHGGKYAVYAGSYLLDVRAASEKERLAGAGLTLTLKRVEVAIPSRVLTAGTFSEKKGAEAALKKLKAAGLKASLTHHQ